MEILSSKLNKLLIVPQGKTVYAADHSPDRCFVQHSYCQLSLQSVERCHTGNRVEIGVSMGIDLTF